VAGRVYGGCLALAQLHYGPQELTWANVWGPNRSPSIAERRVIYRIARVHPYVIRSYSRLNATRGKKRFGMTFSPKSLVAVRRRPLGSPQFGERLRCLTLPSIPVCAR